MTTDIARDGITVTTADDRWPRWRVWTIRIWYGLLSLWALSMSAGVVRLALGQAGPGERFAYATVTAWKLLAVGGVLAICWTGGRSVVAFQAVACGQLCWILAESLYAAQPADATPVGSAVGTVVLWLVPLLLLQPDRRELLRLRTQPSAILLPLALAAAVPLAIYAAHQGNLANDPAHADSVSAYDTTLLGVVLAGQAVFAALRPRCTVWLPRLVALAAAWIGLAGVIWPDDMGSIGRGWGAAVIAGAIAFAAANEAEARRDRPTATLPA